MNVLVWAQHLKICILALATTLFVGNAWCQNDDSILLLGKDSVYHDVDPYLYILDSHNQPSHPQIEEVISPKMQKHFIRLASNYLDSYHGAKSQWLRLRVKFTGSLPEKWLLAFSDPEWTCYFLDKEGKLQTYSSGIYQPLSERFSSKNYRDIASAPIVLLPGHSYTFWIQIRVNPFPYTGRHQNLVSFNRTILPSDAAISNLHRKDFANIIILGILITVCFYHLIIFLYYRDWRFFHLGYYNFSHFLIILFYNGWLLEACFSEHPETYYEFIEEMILIFSAVSVFFLLRSFFETKEKFPWWDNVLKGILTVHISAFGCVLLCRIISQDLYYQVFPFILTPWILFNFGANIFNLVLGVHATQKGIRNADIYLASFFVLVFGITIEHLCISGLIQNISSPYFLPREWGATFQCIILAFGLAKSFKALSDEKYEANLQHQLDLERIKREQEVNYFKNKLYDNITHEFRTPLTIIKGMARQIPQQPLVAMDAISRNSNQLLQLVNDMLALSQSDLEESQINLRQSDLIPFLKYLVASLRGWANESKLILRFQAEEERLFMDFDRKKFQHIIFNLLSNAIKFTPEGGEIIVSVKLSKAGNESSIQYVEIRVTDTGSGIASQDIPHIFNRYYQADHVQKSQGSGIGLAIVKDMVDLHEGRIHVKSNLGAGSSFILQFPVRRDAKIDPLAIQEDKTIRSLPTEEGKKTPIETSLSLILLIEDEPDLRDYLQGILEDRYELMMANDGVEGLEKALEHTPDVIISDIMMPKRDGYELSKMLKNDIRTSHIPILLLSAKDDLNARLKGTRAGADAHLGKPFNEEELIARLEQLIAANKQLRKALEKQTSNSEAEIVGESTLEFESSFLKKAREVVETHLTDSKFDVNVMSEELMMSRSQLYRKIRALTNRSTSSFIRLIRLQKAFNLLRTTDDSITQVAYQVGFNDPTYFARCFRQEFGRSPRDLREK